MISRARRAIAIRQSGFSLFELMIVVCVIALLAGLLLNRMQLYEEAAEKAVMQQTVAAIKSALQMRAAAYMIAGREGDIERLPGMNPVNLLQEKPAN